MFVHSNSDGCASVRYYNRDMASLGEEKNILLPIFDKGEPVHYTQPPVYFHLSTVSPVSVVEPQQQQQPLRRIMSPRCH